VTGNSKTPGSSPGIYLLDQVLEDSSMEREKKVPIEAAEETLRCKIGANNESPFENSGHDLKFQPGLPRNFHLSPQEEPLVFTHVFNAPEVNDLPEFHR
jgi:hypothetical protein